MNLQLINRIAESLLYEGYLLYPYRSSSLKNRLRFNYGVVYPPGCAGESSTMQTECIVTGSAEMELSVDLRFLQIHEGDDSQTAVEQAVHCGVVRNLLFQRKTFEFPPIHGELRVDLTACGPSAYRIRAEVVNESKLEGAPVLQSLISTHTILSVVNGEFVSSIDPPEELREAVAACRNVGTWPVLVGEAGERDCMLSSPIILYDYPQLAPESPGDFFDATEIEELLALRVLTLSDDEKRELRSGDTRAKDILDRMEALPAEHLSRLHGALRRNR